MHLRQLRELAAMGEGLRTEQEINRWLDAKSVDDPTDRIAIKLELQAAGEMATDRTVTIGELATDTANYRPATPKVSKEVETWARRAGLDLTRSYSEAELDEVLDGTPLGATARIALKATFMDLGRLRAAATRRSSLQAGRDMQASADRPRQVLRDATGQPLTLRARL